MKNIGILGGGQLGRMLLQAAVNYPVITHILDKDPSGPSAHLCHHFTSGDITDFDAVYNFGRALDALTIEIESVNTDALEKLESEGVKVFPSVNTLRIIKDKILQKEFYKEFNIPSSEFVITNSVTDIHQHVKLLPAVHKLATGGYDGRGVQIINSATDADKGFDKPAVLEKKVNILQEISVIIARSITGETVLYPAVEMVFDPVLNLLSHQVSPAKLPEKVLWKAEAISLMVVKNLNSPGIFAVELFADIDGNVLVNETAPRVHNSGHHTIEACYSSQFDMLWRIMLGFPLGNTDHILPAALVNIIGEEGYNGVPVYKGLNEILAMDNVFVHIYGKQETRPGRKMGHITILSNEKQELIHKANQIKQLISVQC
jgi:5-(carboxyamino)imidazole ribonucleotide synthase